MLKSMSKVNKVRKYNSLQSTVSVSLNKFSKDFLSTC